MRLHLPCEFSFCEADDRHPNVKHLLEVVEAVPRTRILGIRLGWKLRERPRACRPQGLRLGGDQVAREVWPRPDQGARPEVLEAPRAFAAVEDDFRAESSGELNLKGIREPVEVFRLAES